MRALANAFFLAAAYLRYHSGRSLVLVLVAALILFVPFAAQILLTGAETRLTARADATPLLLGRRGSALDLTMAALYFADERPQPVPMSEVETIWESGLGAPIPLHAAFETNGFRIVGTSLDYFEFRGSTLSEGRMLAVLGEAVIGADVAEALDKSVGDTVISSPENLFDLDGVYPLEMAIVGVLAKTNTPDDAAVFVDIKTAWVISGIGHGHEDVGPVAAAGREEGREESEPSGADGAEVVAPAAIRHFQRITPETIDSFHFHGDSGSYPATAVIVAPYDKRSETILLGRYLDPDLSVQMVRPPEVMQRLVERIFRIKALLDAVTLIVGAAAFAALGLATFLSWRLRAREVQTAVKIGARPWMIATLFSAETVLVIAAAGIAATGGVLVVASHADAWVDGLLALGA
ncbi:MAG: ABC transporter permease [Pseudomonadota bacterium]